MSFKPVPLFVFDSTSKQEDGRFIGTFDIITKERYEEGTKVIADVKPYGGNYPDRDEAEKYAKLFAAAPDLLNVIRLAVNIKDLWAPPTDPSIEYEGEAQALQSMLLAFEAAIKKATL